MSVMSPQEGQLYKVLQVAGQSFSIYYGYYSDTERECWDPVPVFPDFLKTPCATCDGRPFVTAVQEICSYFEENERPYGEEWCRDCIHFLPGEEQIGVCQCEQNKRRPGV